MLWKSRCISVRRRLDLVGKTVAECHLKNNGWIWATPSNLICNDDDDDDDDDGDDDADDDDDDDADDVFLHNWHLFETM